MKLSFSAKARQATIIQFVYSDEIKKVSPSIADFKGEKDEVTVRYDGAKTLVFCGLGEKSERTDLLLRAAAARGIQKAIKLKRQDVSLVAPLGSDQAMAAACVEGALLGAYSFTKYKKEKPASLALVELVASALPNLQMIQAACDGTNAARDHFCSSCHSLFPLLRWGLRMSARTRRAVPRLLAVGHTCNVRSA